MKPIKLIASLLCAMILAGIAFAQEESGALPGDPLYQAKRKTETAQLNASVDPLERANLHLGHAGERLAEAQSMVSRGRHESVDDLMMNYETSMSEAMADINRAQAQGRDVSTALSAVERFTTQNTEVLGDLLGKVPEEAKPAIERAMDASQRGRNTALDRMEGSRMPGERRDGMTRPERPGPLEGTERPGRPDIPGGMDRPGGMRGPGGMDSSPGGFDFPGSGRPEDGPSGGRGR